MKTILETPKKFGFTAVATILFLIPTLSSFAQDATIQKALYLLDTEQPKKALELAAQTVKASPTLTAQQWYYYGYVLIQAGKKEEALTAFDKGLQLDEKEALNYAGKGWVRFLEGNPESKTLLDKALSMTKSKNKD